MNLQPPRDPWSRLVSSARNVRDERDTAAPFGFSTRVAALAFAAPRRGVSVFERFALRAVGVASLLAIGSVAMNYNAISLPATSSPAMNVALADTEVATPTDDTVSIVLGFAD